MEGKQDSRPRDDERPSDRSPREDERHERIVRALAELVLLDLLSNEDGNPPGGHD